MKNGTEMSKFILSKTAGIKQNGVEWEMKVHMIGQFFDKIWK